MIVLSKTTPGSNSVIVLENIDYGASELRKKPSRVVRVKTIDGGVAIINSGYTDGDRTIKVTVLDVDRTQADSLDEMQQNTTIINLSMDDGFYSAAIKSSDVKNGKATLIIFIKEKLSA